MKHAIQSKKRYKSAIALFQPALLQLSTVALLAFLSYSCSDSSPQAVPTNDTTNEQSLSDIAEHGYNNDNNDNNDNNGNSGNSGNYDNYDSNDNQEPRFTETDNEQHDQPEVPTQEPDAPELSIGSSFIISSSISVASSSSYSDNPTASDTIPPNPWPQEHWSGSTTGLIWDESWAGGTAQGGWWGGAAENGAGESWQNAIVCGSAAWAAGEETEQFGDYCLNGSTMGATVNVVKGVDANGDNWGYALIGVDIMEGKTPYNALSAGGISVNYNFSTPTNIVVKTPNDLMDDGYQKKGVRGNASVWIPWGDLRKNNWSPAFDFDPTQIESIHFRVESEGEHTISVYCIAFGAGC
jgi:hypothetical protein